MGLRLKFNLMLLIVFLAGFAAIGVVAQRYLENQAIDDAQRAALMVLDAAGFANLDPRIASGIGSRLVDMKIREFSPEENLRGIEAQVAQRMKSLGKGQMSEVITTTAGERRLAVARTFRATADGATTIRLANVDLAPILVTVNLALTTLMSSIGAVFFAVFIVLNIMLDRMIVRPVAEMALQADAVSIGNFSIPEFAPKSRDEIGVLGVAFNRMRRSTEEAIKLLKGADF
ncbi:MAG: HAMP domain-containing protein [Burkholderiales bacterium]|nr:HAMP domain-containing protein [Burkholderiales bacterium]